MKEVLLVMPRITYAINDWNIPPVGILYVSAAMKKAGLKVHTLNLNNEYGDVFSAIKKTILEHDIDIVCTGDLVVNYNAVKEVVDSAKKAKKDIVTIIGGGLVTHSPEEAMEIIDNADFGVIGEGEITDVELVKALEQGKDIEKVDGIIYREGTVLKKTNPRMEIMDLDSLPFPDYEGFQYFELVKKSSHAKSLSAPITTSRSCPFSCTFCSKSGGGRYRQRSLENIFVELDFLIDKYGITEIFLNDELFADKLDRVKEFCSEIKKRGLNWHVMLRVSKQLTAELLQEMKHAGCVGVCYGLESADNEVLKSMRKGTTVEMMEHVVKITKEAGLNIRGGFIFGDQAETKETIAKTMDWILDNMEYLGNTSISPIILYPGAGLYDLAVEKGIIKSSKDHILRGCPLVNISKMSDEEYIDIIEFEIPKFAALFRKRFSDELIKELKEEIKAAEGNKSYEHTFICRNCGERISHEIFPTDLFQRHFACSCGEKYDFFPNYLYYYEFTEEITKELSKDKVALWGIGETLNCLYQCNEYLRDHDVTLIDSAESKRRKGFEGRKVNAPDIIDEKGIKEIICCVGNVYYKQLIEEIPKKYPNVEKIIWLNEIGLRQ